MFDDVPIDLSRRQIVNFSNINHTTFVLSKSNESDIEEVALGSNPRFFPPSDLNPWFTALNNGEHFEAVKLRKRTALGECEIL